MQMSDCLPVGTPASRDPVSIIKVSRFGNVFGAIAEEEQYRPEAA